MFAGTIAVHCAPLYLTNAAFRQRAEKTNRVLAKLPDGVIAVRVSDDEIEAESIVPEGAPADRVLLYVHGGYVSGSVQDHRSIVGKVAKQCGLRTFLFEYRLPPEHPCPAALGDAVAAYRWLLVQAGEDEVLRDDAIRFAEKARAAGVEVTLRVGEAMVHCYPPITFPPPGCDAPSGPRLSTPR
jgi:acetyl esterase/lipase